MEAQYGIDFPLPESDDYKNLPNKAEQRWEQETSKKMSVATRSYKDFNTAIADTWKDTFAYGTFEFFKYDNSIFEDTDAVWLKNQWTDEAKMKALEVNKLPMKYWDILNNAKNKEHKDSLIELARNRHEREVFATKNFSDNEKLWYTLATNVFGDIDTPIALATAGVGAALKSTKIGMSVGAASHTAAVHAAGEVQTDMTGTEKLVFSAIGGLVSGISAKQGVRARESFEAQGAALKAELNKAQKEKETVIETQKAMAKAQYELKKDIIARQAARKDKQSDSKNGFQDFAASSRQIQREALEQENIRLLNADEARVNTMEADIATKREIVSKIIESDPKSTAIQGLKKEIKELEKTVKAERKQIKEAREKLSMQSNEMRAVERSFKKLDEASKRTEREIFGLKESDNVMSSSWIKKREEWSKKAVRELGEDLKMNIAEWRVAIREATKKKDVDFIEDLKGAVKVVFDNGAISKGEYEHFMNQLSSGKITFPKIKLKMNKEGKYELADGSKKGMSTGKKLAIGGASAMAFAGAAEASDGSISTSSIPAAILTAVLLGLGVGAGMKYFKNKGIRDALEKESKKLDTAEKAQPMMEKVDGYIQGMRSKYLETKVKLEKNETDEFKKLVGLTLFDPLETVTLPMERHRDQLFKSWSLEINDTSNIAYDAFVKNNGRNRMAVLAENLFSSEVTSRVKFERMVMENMQHGAHSDIPEIVDAASKLKSIKSKIVQEMKDAGVKNAEFMKNDDIIQRYIRSGDVAVTIRALRFAKDQTQYDKFLDNVTPMFGDRNKAEDYFTLISEGHMQGSHRFTDTESIKKFLSDNGLTSITPEEASKMLGVDRSASGRTKYRTKIDTSKFKDFDVTIDGKTTTISLDSLFVNNAIEAMEKLAAEAAGHVALADKGFKSIDDFTSQVMKTAKNPENAKVLQEVVDIMVGKSIMDVGKTAQEMLELVGPLTVIGTMPLSVLSMMQETLVNIAKYRGGVAMKELLSELRNVVFERGGSSKSIEELVNFYGEGAHGRTMSFGMYSHLSEGIDNVGQNATHKTSRVAKAASHFVLKNLGMVRVSDGITRLALKDTNVYMYDVARGAKKMDAYDRKMYGFTKETEDVVNKHFVKNNDGTYSWNFDKMTRAEQLEVRKVSDAMMMKRVQKETMGGTPHGFRKTTAGAIVSMLLKFSIQAYSNHGVADIRGAIINKDPRSMFAMMAWFAGGYMAAYSRASIKGKEIDEDEILMHAFLSMPQIGIVGLPKVVTDGPAVMGATNNYIQGANEVISIIGGAND